MQRLDLKMSNVFSRYSWMFENIRRYFDANKWYALPLPNSGDRCVTCAPNKPEFRWRLRPDGESIEPYEDPMSAASYERTTKRRPADIVVDAEQNEHNHAEVSQIKIGINVTSLAHRAAARLPPGKAETKFAWKLMTDFSPGINFSFCPFKLKPIQGIKPFASDLKMSVKLFPNQLRSLAWMIRQEAGDGREYAIEESEEARLPKLGWTVEMRVQTSVRVRGGICADHPGYGKTILSLALLQRQLQEQDPVELLEELRHRQASRAPGLIPTRATLVECPRTLVDQWVQEATEKFGLKEEVDVVSIKTTRDLGSKTVAQLSEAKMIIISSGVLGSESYVERLAAFAGLPPPTTVKGRVFAKWLEYAIKQVPEHVRILQESGHGRLREFVKEKYARNIHSEDFKAVVPSRRLRGKEYAAAQKSKATPKPVKAAAPVSLDTKTVGNPLLEMFYFNRIFCDEYHQFDSTVLTATKALRADKIWGLSGTPAIGDIYDVSKVADLLAVQLKTGSDSRRVLKAKSIREYRNEMTPFERFDSLRQMPSDSTLARKQELAQNFLDVSTTRNVADFPLDCKEHLVPVTLAIDHLAVYTELAQQLNSVDMRYKKGAKSKTTDREIRLFDALDASETSEEALSRTAAFYERSGQSAKTQLLGLKDLVSRRCEEAAQCEAHISTKVSEAEKVDPVAFEQWRQASLNANVLGDNETVEFVVQLCKNDDSKSKALASRASKGDREDRAKDLISEINKLVGRLVVANRSLRFVKAVRAVQDATSNNGVTVQCDNASCKASCRDQDIGVSAFCGHVLCRTCFKHMQRTLDAQCAASGCKSIIQKHHVLWKQKMGDLQSTRKAPYGAKIDAVIKLLRDIKKQGDQAILFVQYKSQLDQVGRALQEHGVSAEVIDQEDTASRRIEAFKANEKITALVLNASAETAAGLNLQNANHVIFLSPLLRDQQYSYEATMAQAVGRVRRHGQQKEIHVYRIVALDTIDVDILEHRERRTSAIVEIGAPEIDPPSPAWPGYMPGRIHGAAEPERTQLVRENGVFSLQPQSWLVRCGADNRDDELAKIRGTAGSDRLANEQRIKMKGRVLGWEDFSSLIKFSRAYTEDDE